MDKQPRPLFMRLLRDLVEAYQAFEGYALPHIKAQGLTPAQFDVLATLGNTDGMSFKALGQHTLIYKTTLTSVIDRLEERGLVRRRQAENDRRSMMAELTDEGHQLFDEFFPAHSEHLRRKLEKLSESEMQEVRASLARIRDVFS